MGSPSFSLAPPHARRTLRPRRIGEPGPGCGRGPWSAGRCRSRALAMRCLPADVDTGHMAETSDLVSDTALEPIGSVRRTQVGREATEPMREDIRLLGCILGDTVREQNGDEVFDLVERARVESFRVRRSEIDRAELRELFDGIDVRPGHSGDPRVHATSRCWPTSPRTSTANGAAPSTSRQANRRSAAAWPPRISSSTPPSWTRPRSPTR